jgi:hypothetical protein
MGSGTRQFLQKAVRRGRDGGNGGLWEAGRQGEGGGGGGVEGGEEGMGEKRESLVATRERERERARERARESEV